MFLYSHQSFAKYEDTTKTKYMTGSGLMDKAIAKVNQNDELDWYMRIFSIQLILYLKTTGYSLTAHSYVKSKFKMAFIWAVIT